MNKLIIIGHIGRNAELSQTKSGMSISKFSVASSKKRNGETKTEWFSCVLFGKRADALSQWLLKGVQVYIEGEVATNEYIGKDGNSRKRMDVLVSDLQLLSSRKDDSSSNHAEKEWEPEHKPRSSSVPNPSTIKPGIQAGIQPAIQEQAPFDFESDIPF